jgi:thiol-disulfide isomerase/thioredoxin
MRLSRCSFLVALLYNTATEYSNAFQPPTNPSPQRSVLAARASSPAVEDHRTPPAVLVSPLQPEDPDDPELPILGDQGIYHIRDAAEHAALVRNFKNQIIVVKCYSPWCRGCKHLEPKFIHVRHDPVYQSLPIVWADLTSVHNADLIAELGVVALPSIQFHVNGQLRDSFLCGPSKIAHLRQKLGHLVNACVDVKTRLVKDTVLSPESAEDGTAEERKTASVDHYIHFLRGKAGRLSQAKAHTS